MSWAPELRADVVLEEGALRDPVLDRRIPLGPLSQALVERMGVGASAQDVVALAASARKTATSEAEEALRALALLNLLEGCGSATVERLRARDARERSPKVLPQARFGCVASGQCCRVYRPGPLTPQDLASLEEVTPALLERFPDLPAAPWTEERPGEGGVPWTYLQRREGRCVFLREDQRCGIHAVAGLHKKPEACRLFPFDAVMTLDGLRVFDVSQCSAFAETSQRGDLHSAAADEVALLSAKEPALYHPSVLLDAGLPCDYGHLAPLEARLLALSAERPLATRLSTCAAAARAHATALGSAPLRADGVDAAAQEIARAPLEPLPRASNEEVALAWVAVGAALERAVANEHEREAPLADAFLESVDAARSLAAVRAGLAEGELPELLVHAVALPLEREVADAMLRASLRNRLFGARLLVGGRLRAGILRLALLEQLTLTAARLRAALDGAARVEARHLSAGHWVASLSLARKPIAASLSAVEAHAYVVASACGT